MSFLLASPTAHGPAFEAAAPAYEMRFVSLHQEGRAMAFPCDGAGHVDCDQLSPRALRNYLYARAMIGREFAMPAVQPCYAATH